MVLTDEKIDKVADRKMQIYWVVADLRGPRRVLDAQADVFSSYTEALNECKNRGRGFVPLVLNPQDVLRLLIEENIHLREENERLRDAIEASDEW